MWISNFFSSPSLWFHDSCWKLSCHDANFLSPVALVPPVMTKLASWRLSVSSGHVWLSQQKSPFFLLPPSNGDPAWDKRMKLSPGAYWDFKGRGQQPGITYGRTAWGNRTDISDNIRKECIYELVQECIISSANTLEMIHTQTLQLTLDTKANWSVILKSSICIWPYITPQPLIHCVERHLSTRSLLNWNSVKYGLRVVRCSEIGPNIQLHLTWWLHKIW